MNKTTAAVLVQILLLSPLMASEVLLPGYPNRGTSCEANAAQLAHVVSQATQASFAKGECTIKKWTHSDIKVRYEAASPVTLSPLWPVFSTQIRCEAALEAESNWFRSVTGLTPFLQYCSQDRNSSSFDGNVYGYSPRLLAVGTGPKQIKSHSMRLNGYYFGPKKSNAEIVKQSQAAGIPLVQAHFADFGYESELVLRFAVDSDSPYLHRLDDQYLLSQEIESGFTTDLFREINPMRFLSGQECYDQLSRAEAMMAPHWEGPVVWFCTWDRSLFRATLYHLRITPGWERFARVVPGEDGEPVANKYSSLQACEQDKPRILQRYREKYGEALVGALCGSPRGRDSYFKPAQVFIYLKE